MGVGNIDSPQLMIESSRKLRKEPAACQGRILYELIDMDFIKTKKLTETIEAGKMQFEELEFV